MSKREKARSRPVPRAASRGGSGQMSVRTSRIIFAVLAVVVILTMVMALALTAFARTPS